MRAQQLEAALARGAAMAVSKASRSAATDPNGRRRHASCATHGECSTADPRAATKASESIASTSAMDDLTFRALSAMRPEGTRPPRMAAAAPARRRCAIIAPACRRPDRPGALRRARPLQRGARPPHAALRHAGARRGADARRRMDAGGGPRDPPRPARQPRRPPAGTRRAHARARLAPRHGPGRRAATTARWACSRRWPARSACGTATCPSRSRWSGSPTRRACATARLPRQLGAGGPLRGRLARARRRRRGDARGRRAGLGRRSGGDRRGRPPPRGAARLRRGPHRAGPGAGRPRACRWAWSPASPGRRAPASRSRARPGTPARRRWRAGATRWPPPPSGSARSRPRRRPRGPGGDGRRDRRRSPARRT